MKYMGSIADLACHSAASKWSSAWGDVEKQMIIYKTKLGERVDNEDYDVDVYNDGQRELGGLSDEESKSLISQWESTRDKLTKLLGSPYHYC